MLVALSILRDNDATGNGLANMFKGDWDGQFGPFMIVAIGLLLIGFIAFNIAYSKGYQTADERHAAEYADYQAAQRDREKCLAEPTVEKALECYEEANNAPRDAKRSEQDLDAQREMANWAESMLWATLLLGLLSLGVGVAGIIFVRRTLDANLSANKSASEQFAAEHRPWLDISIDNTVPNSGFIFTSSGAQTWIKMILKNVGHAPAIKIRGTSWPIYNYSENHPPREKFEDWVRLMVGPLKLASDDLGQVVFPGRDGSLSSFVTFPRSGLESTVYPSLENVADGKRFIGPYVAVIVYYQGPGSPEIFYTAYLFELLDKWSDRVSLIVMDRNIPDGSLVYETSTAVAI